MLKITLCAIAAVMSLSGCSSQTAAKETISDIPISSVTVNQSSQTPASSEKSKEEQGENSTFVEGLGSPAGLAFDIAGNLYVADYTEDVIYRIQPNGEKTVFAEGLHTPTGIAFNKAGDLLISNRGSNEIVKIDPAGKILQAADGMKTPVGVVEDADGNLYVTNYGGGQGIIGRRCLCVHYRVARTYHSVGVPE